MKLAVTRAVRAASVIATFVQAAPVQSRLSISSVFEQQSTDSSSGISSFTGLQAAKHFDVEQVDQGASMDPKIERRTWPLSSPGAAQKVGSVIHFDSELDQPLLHSHVLDGNGYQASDSALHSQEATLHDGSSPSTRQIARPGVALLDATLKRKQGRPLKYLDPTYKSAQTVHIQQMPALKLGRPRGKTNAKNVINLKMSSENIALLREWKGKKLDPIKNTELYDQVKALCKERKKQVDRAQKQAKLLSMSADQRAAFREESKLMHAMRRARGQLYPHEARRLQELREGNPKRLIPPEPTSASLGQTSQVQIVQPAPESDPFSKAAQKQEAKPLHLDSAAHAWSSGSPPQVRGATQASENHRLRFMSDFKGEPSSHFASPSSSADGHSLDDVQWFDDFSSLAHGQPAPSQPTSISTLASDHQPLALQGTRANPSFWTESHHLVEEPVATGESKSETESSDPFQEWLVRVIQTP